MKKFNIKDPKIRKEYKLDDYPFETPLNKSFEYKYIQQFLNVPSSSEEYDFIREFDGQKVAKPLREELSPHPLYLGAHRKLHGFQ